jgi:GMP synthase-like glutamine amidotransferase
MLRALIIQHLACEGPARLRPLLEGRGYAIDTCHAFDGGVVPAVLDHDLLVVMGGSMGVADVGDPRYPFLAAEVALLRSALQRQQPVLGICLGAQLLAHAAGARVQPNRRDGRIVREVGWAPVDFLGAGQRPELAGIGPREMMLHWHGDTFDLPQGAIHLASTPACANQLFRLPRQVGIQFHPEIDAGSLEEWVRLDAAYVASANGPQGGERILADTGRYLEHHHRVGDRLLDNLIGEITAPGTAPARR